MLSLEEINKLILAEAVELSKHAHKRMLDRNIYFTELKECTSNNEVIEDYNDDKYGPTCLLLGTTKGKRPLHMIVTKFLTSGSNKTKTKVVSLYEPDPNEWEDDFRTRRK